MPAPSNHVQTFLSHRARLFKGPHLHGNIYRAIHEYNDLFIAAVKETLEHIRPPASIFASGSFARRELSPYSSAELLLIPEDSASISSLNECIAVIQAFSRLCSVPIAVFLVDPEEPQVINLETVFRLFAASPQTVLYGSGSTYIRPLASLRAHLGAGGRDSFVEDALKQREARKQMFGSSPSLLEPHLLNSPGGLMDVRICELLCGLITGSPVPLDLSSPYEQTLIAHLTGHGFLPSAEGLALQSAYSLLLETRFQLHLHNRNRSDWFEYSAQKSLTRQLYDGQRSSYVQYMRHFYAATRICARTFTTIVKKYQSFRNRAVPDQLSESLDAPFTFKAGRISLSSTTTVTVQTAMKAFYYRGVYGAQLDDELRCAILAYQPGELPDDDRFESFIYFRKILALENTIGVTLRAMNELQFLGKFLPEFAEIEGLPQHHLYHYYTVDEHILQAIDAASKLDPFTTLSGRVFKLLPRKELLFLALLFHDIAKHITREGHELIGAECAVSYMENNGYDDDEIELVNFLVRCHEVLYKTITRKKSGSREAVSALAPLFKSSESLDYLFALTCADLSAANPRILNSWKTGLLDRLYLDIREFLAAGSAPPESSVLREQLSESLPPITSPFEERTDQPDLFDVESVNAGSADALRKIAQGASAAIEWKHRERDTLIFIYTPARFNLMARTFGILSYNGAAINRAYAATREDALVRLTFEVNDAKTAGKLSDAATTKIENDLSLVASGFMQVGFEMKQLKQQWNALKRTLLGKKLQHKIGFTADDTYTILSIHYPHIPGLDYQILQKLYDLGLVVYFMKLETDGDSCASTFHLLDGRKRKISGTFNHFIEGELRALIGK